MNGRIAKRIRRVAAMLMLNDSTSESEQPARLRRIAKTLKAAYKKLPYHQRATPVSEAHHTTSAKHHQHAYGGPAHEYT